MIDLNDSFFDFIEAHSGEDPAAIGLRFAGRDCGFDLRFALVQIAARRHTAAKLRPFVANPRFIFPTPLSAEQASDWRVAEWHASLTGRGRLLDLTAGLGIDAMTAASHGAAVTAVDMEEAKCRALRHNSKAFGVPVEVVCDTAENIVASLPGDSYDTIFADPSRRDSKGWRTHAFADCSPDIASMMRNMLAAAPRVVVKASPLLDVSAVCSAFPEVAEVAVVGVGGEVKEVTAILGREPVPDPLVRTVMIGRDSTTEIAVRHSETGPTGAFYAQAGDIASGHWLYEPDATLMKTAPWRWLCRRFDGLAKISRDTHLFIADRHIDGFPGRAVRITALPDRKGQKALKGIRANVAVRNHPLGAEALRRKLGVKDGGETFVYGFRNSEGLPVIVVAERVVS